MNRINKYPCKKKNPKKKTLKKTPKKNPCNLCLSQAELADWTVIPKVYCMLNAIESVINMNMNMKLDCLLKNFSGTGCSYTCLTKSTFRAVLHINIQVRTACGTWQLTEVDPDLSLGASEAGAEDSDSTS